MPVYWAERLAEFLDFSQKTHATDHLEETQVSRGEVSCRHRILCLLMRVVDSHQCCGGFVDIRVLHAWLLTFDLSYHCVWKGIQWSLIRWSWRAGVLHNPNQTLLGKLIKLLLVQGCPNSVQEGRCPAQLAPTSFNTPALKFLVYLVEAWIAPQGVFDWGWS